MRGLAGAALGVAGAAASPGVGPLEVATTAVLGAALALPPLVAWPVVLAGLGVTATAGEPDLPAYFLLVVHAFNAARRLGPSTSAVVVVSELAVIEAAITSHAGEGQVPAFLFLTAAWGTGRALGTHERLLEQLAERARELESERELHAQLAVANERARIAAELHDIVAHAISIMVVQATAGQRSPALSASTLQTIAEAAREAESDMGRLVALLADEEADPPDHKRIRELVRRAADSGIAVTARFEGELADAQLGYRVVQEGLTNALRYAAGAPVEVIVREDAVEVVNGPGVSASPVAATGHGLRGLRERLSARGGTLEAGSTPGGGWRLAAQLPHRHTASRDA